MKIKPKLIFIVLLAALPLIGANCGLPTLATPTPTSTATLVPTLTYTPTASDAPLPTSTFTPLPTATATPDIKATQAAQKDQEVRAAMAMLGLPSDTGQLGWYQQGEEIAITQIGEVANWEYQFFAEDITASDFVVSTDMIWDTNGMTFCGFWFRADNRGNMGDFYPLTFMRFSGLPGWDIEYWRNGKYNKNVTGKVRYTSFLDIADGAKNTIVLSAVDNAFKVYVNGNYEGQFLDYNKSLKSGKFTLAGFQESGSSVCSFNNTWIWIYK